MYMTLECVSHAVQLQLQVYQHAAWCIGSCDQQCNKAGSVNVDMSAAAASLPVNTAQATGAARRQSERRKRCIVLMVPYVCNKSTVPSQTGVGVQNPPGPRGCHGQAFALRHSSTPETSGPTTGIFNWLSSYLVY